MRTCGRSSANHGRRVHVGRLCERESFSLPVAISASKCRGSPEALSDFLGILRQRLSFPKCRRQVDEKEFVFRVIESGARRSWGFPSKLPVALSDDPLRAVVTAEQANTDDRAATLLRPIR